MTQKIKSSKRVVWTRSNREIRKGEITIIGPYKGEGEGEGEAPGGRALRGGSAAAPRHSRTTNLGRSRELGQHRENPSVQALFGEYSLKVSIVYSVHTAEQGSQIGP